MADVLRLLDGGQGIEDVLAVDAVAAEGVDGEVADAERGEVLEEVGALAGVDLEVVQAGFYDDLRGADVRPLDGDAQPRVAAPPAAGADEEIGSSLPLPLQRRGESSRCHAVLPSFGGAGGGFGGKERPVYPLYLFGDGGIA